MTKRRALLALTVASLLPAAQPLGRSASAQGATGRASAFIKSTGDKLVSVVNGPENDREKRTKLTQIIDSAVDVDGVARFCLGRFWRNASPEQQQRYAGQQHHCQVR